MRTEMSCPGTLVHVRRRPRRHAFRYRVWMLYLDAESAGPPVLSSRWLPLSANRGHLLSAAEVRERLAANGLQGTGSARNRVFALTQPRSLGFSFNPVNFYFCFAGDRLTALLADVHNTPWDERHCYVLDAEAARRAEGCYDFRFPKQLHVSPFLTMNGHYHLRLRFSEGRLRIAMRFANSEGPLFACLSLRTRPLTRKAAAWGALRWPAQNALTLARIHWQAALLFVKRTPFHPHPQAGGAREPLAQRLVQRALGAVDGGTLKLQTDGQTRAYGRGEPEVRLTVHDPTFYRRLALQGSVGAGESYMDGQWDCDDLVELVRIMARNRPALERLDGWAAAPAALANAIGHWRRRNSRHGSRRNIGAHYDLGDELFRLFLDRRMMYSAAVYDRGDETLDEASEAKLKRLCRKLDLKPGDHLLEIGCGWGGLALFAAERFGCRVTAVTISKAQRQRARQLVAEYGLGDQVQVKLCDYRDLRGRYDKLVSVEMVEAVGHEYLDGYFRACARLLRPGGLMAMQAIVIRDSAYRRALRRADFIKKHIFPGGFMPSVSVLTAAAAKADLSLANLEDFAADYALTLREWRRRLDANAARAKALGFDERFLRLWRFYFAYCEGGFMERTISDVQMLFTMPGRRGPIWRLPLDRP